VPTSNISSTGSVGAMEDVGGDVSDATEALEARAGSSGRVYSPSAPQFNEGATPAGP
jgi:hypothetical protein